MYRKITALLGLGLLPLALMAETIRCSDQIVEQDMKQSEVQKLCGSPDEVQRINDYAWIYRKGDLSPDPQHDVVIHFYSNGHVRYIETVDEYSSDY